MIRNVTIVGAGALGSHLALFARNWPQELEVHLRVVDDDRVEAKNLAAQAHSKMGLGKNKVVALKQLLQGLYGLNLDIAAHRVTENSIVAMLSDSTLVVDCTDNAATRRLLQTHCAGHHLPLLHGALSADATLGLVDWSPSFTVDEEGAPGQPTCENGLALPFHALVAAQLALTAQRFLSAGEQRSYQITPTGILRVG